MNSEKSRWLKIIIPKDPGDQEQLLARLTQWGMLGLQETDTGYEIYFPYTMKTVIPRLIDSLRAEWPDAKPEVSEIVDDGWGTKWQEYFKPQIISAHIAVRPFWENPQNVSVEIILKPGMAFGTGTHATTRMALRMLEKYLKSGMSVLDAGCGSGILTIAALKMGVGAVEAWDIDPDVVENFEENLQLNGLSGRTTVNIGDVTQLPDYHYDLIVSNIERQPNLRLLETLDRHKNHSMVIFTGLLIEESEIFSREVINYGREIVDQDIEDEWLVLVVK